VKLYTIQDLATWERAKDIGYLSGHNADHLKGDDIFKIAYNWMKEQLVKRINNFSGDYPVWSWPIDQKEDYYIYQEKSIKITFEVPDNRVCASNFCSWHFVLNNDTDYNWEEIFDLDLWNSEDYKSNIQICVDRVYLSEVIEVEFVGIDHKVNMEIKIKEAITQAVRHKDNIARDVLRLALGEIQLKSVNGDIPEADKIAIVRKIIKSNNETIEAYNTRNLDPEALYKENEVLEILLPKSWSSSAIEEYLIKEGIDFKAAKNDGQAVGMAMKALKKVNAPVDSEVVKVVVAKLR
jgi:hypothetical protein